MEHASYPLRFPTSAVQLLALEGIPLALALHEEASDLTRLRYLPPATDAGEILREFHAHHAACPGTDIEILYLANPQQGEAGWQSIPDFA